MKTWTRFGLLAAVLLLVSACSDAEDVLAPQAFAPEAFDVAAEAPDAAATWAFSYQWDQTKGLDSEKCGKVGEGQPGQRPPEGWMHWLFLNKGDSENALLVLRRGEEVLGEFSPGEPLNANNWHFYTPFFAFGEPVDLEATVYLDGEGANPQDVVLSDYCGGTAGETLKVSKTAKTSFKRTHKWDIDKSVDPETIWLYADGTGDRTAEWTVDVDYKGFHDSNFVVEGTILIRNISSDQGAKTINSIVDDLGLDGYEDVKVICKAGDGGGVDLPQAIAFDEEWSCTYRQEIKEGDAAAGDSGTNTVSVTVDGEEDPYEGTADWAFDEPTLERYATITVVDKSDLFGKKTLGTLDAPEGGSFVYQKTFAWTDYGPERCGSFQYGNTATIKETGQSSKATLTVEVQCLLEETAFAKGDDTGNGLTPADQTVAFCDDGFNRWGWTNEVEEGSHTWNLWAGAGQCDTNRGVLVGTVTVDYGEEGVQVTFHILEDEGFRLLEDHVHAGPTRYAQQQQGRRTVDTVAPGQYTIADGLTGNIWVIVHGVVGVPDPAFGPAMD
ncbi:MAG: hypothetical protein EA352_05860 [Gemmatimonadales bacterium]|nr:MAG: hypothetical protein EA352_05860 [Gemmatimonadales bacterium]